MVTFNLQPNSVQPTIRSQRPDPLSPTVDPEQIPVTSASSGNNNIGAFYNGAIVFITGATGFVGKALLEKLLRTCTGVQKIYILIRSKKGQAPEQRLKELIKSPVFDRVRDKTPEYFNKIKAVAGDVSHINLGVCEADRQILTNSITVAFHSAATVRFNENLKDAAILNTLGTKHVIKFCKDMKKLRSFVHVSTAYSNADRREIEEIVYPPPYDPETIIKCVETLPLDTINIITEKIQGKHPNTYTLTKALAEHIVTENSSEFPVAIIRPSIVTAAWKEPFPGWVDNVSGISGIMMEIGRGTIRSIVCEESNTIDVIPVDVVVNTLITAAWHISTHRTNTVHVYNCTSGQMNGISWKNFGELTLKHATEYPSKYTTWYPGFKFRTNRLMHSAIHCFLHVLPAAFLDVILYCTRHKPVMLRICKKIAQATQKGTFFAVNEWKFSNNKLRQLLKDVQSAEDGADFSCLDMSSNASDFNWDPYVESYVLGIRRFVLKDDESTLEPARAKLQRLYWTKRLIQLVSVYIFIRFIWRI